MDDYEDFVDVGYCSRCGKNMRDEPPALTICTDCLDEDES